MRSGTVGIELEGASLTAERVVAETLGATSHRKQARTRRESITFKVLRDDDEPAAEPTVAAAAPPPSAAAPPVRRGRLGSFIRAARARFGRPGGNS